MQLQFKSLNSRYSLLQDYSMSHHENADYEFVEETFLSYSNKVQAFLNNMLSQMIQIVVNLLLNNSTQSLILEDILSSVRLQAVEDLTSDAQMLMCCSCSSNLDDDFLKRIKIKESADYYSKFLQEHSK